MVEIPGYENHRSTRFKAASFFKSISYLSIKYQQLFQLG